MRSARTPDIVVDANQGWPTPKYAIQILERMREYGIRYAEQPVEGLRQMAAGGSRDDCADHGRRERVDATGRARDRRTAGRGHDLALHDQAWRTVEGEEGRAPSPRRRACR